MIQALGHKYGIATKDIPEPGAACLLLLGLSVMLLARSRRARRLGDQHVALLPAARDRVRWSQWPCSRAAALRRRRA